MEKHVFQGGWDSSGMKLRFVAFGAIMMLTITMLVFIFVGHQERHYFTPTMDTYKNERLAPRQDLKTHYHSDLSCPLLLSEVSYPEEIRPVVKKDGMLKQTNSTFQAMREPCRLCTME